MKLAVVAAGFTPGEADQLRRAMGAWRKTGVMDKFRDKLLTGMAERGYPADFAEAVYKQICGFGEYGFPESHAASFALLVYVSAWLKCHHPAAFCAALLNSQPMGFYGPSQLVADAKRHGVEARPVDVNFSDWDCTLEPGVSVPARSASKGEALDPCLRCGLVLGPDEATVHALRLGFRLIRGLSESHIDTVVQARRDGPFRTFAEFVRRTGLRAGALKRLGQADAFGSLDLDRQSTLWKALPERGPLTVYDEVAHDEARADLPPLAPLEEVLADYRAAGLTLRQHPIGFLRAALDALNVVPSDRLPTLDNDIELAVAGIVMLRQRPSTAKGVTFVTLEDETGTVNLIVHMAVWEKYRLIARTAVAMIAHGRLQRDAEVIHVIVTRLEDLTEKLATLSVRSRDFH